MHESYILQKIRRMRMLMWRHVVCEGKVSHMPEMCDKLLCGIFCGLGLVNQEVAILAADCQRG